MSNYDAIVNAVLSAYPDTVAVYRFGSWGTPYQRADSDLDIAILLPYDSAKGIEFADWVSLNGEIAYVSGIDRVDLVNLRAASTDLQAEILRTGDVLFCTDDDKRVEFEALTLSMYQDLNIEREPHYQAMMAECRALQP